MANPLLPMSLPESLSGSRIRYRRLRGNPPIAPAVNGWEIFVGRATSAEEREWLRSHGFSFGRFAWVLEERGGGDLVS